MNFVLQTVLSVGISYDLNLSTIYTISHIVCGYDSLCTFYADGRVTMIPVIQTGGPGTNDEESDPEAAQMLKQLEADMEAKKAEPQDEKDPEPEGTPKSYECQVCG